MCSLNLVAIPQKCPGFTFKNVFEHCVKHYGMVPLGVYKQTNDDQPLIHQGEGNNSQQNQEKKNHKPYMWLHPPQNLELDVHDELFVLSEKNPKESLREEIYGGGRMFADSSKHLKNEEKKTQKQHVNQLDVLNKDLKDLHFSTREWCDDVSQSKSFIKKNLSLKLRTDLENRMDQNIE